MQRLSCRSRFIQRNAEAFAGILGRVHVLAVVTCFLTINASGVCRAKRVGGFVESRPLAIDHKICSAYNAVLAWRFSVLHKDLIGSHIAGEWSEYHAQRAIEIENSMGLQSWTTRDFISNLTSRWKKEIAGEPRKLVELDRMHDVKCAALEREIRRSSRTDR